VSLWLSSLTLSAALVAQVEPTATPPLALPKIRAAVDRLSSADFATRDAASRWLWNQGLAARAELERAAMSGVGETRLRARRILRDFDYGILPGTDPATAAQIRRFRDGNPTARQEAFRELLTREQFDALQRLIRLESNPDVRRSLLSQLFADARTITRFIELDAIEGLIEVVGADQDEKWRRVVTLQLMFAPKMVEHLAQKDQLETLRKLIEDETVPEVRREMLTTIVGNAGTVSAILNKNQLHFILQILQAEPDKAQRGELLAALSRTQTGALLAVDDRLEQVLQFASEHVDEAARRTVLERLFQTPTIIQALTDQGGIQRVLDLAAREQAPAARGRLLGLAFSSLPMRQHLASRQQYGLALKFAKDEVDEVTRHEYLKALLESSPMAFSSLDSPTQRELWQLVKADADRTWRAGAVRILLSTRQGAVMLRDKDELAWLFTVVEQDAPPAERTNLLTVLLGGEFQGLLISRGYFDQLLTLARAEPDPSRGRLLASLVSGPLAMQHLKQTGRLDLLLELAQSETQPRARVDYLQGLFVNPYAMPALLEAGRYDTCLAMIRGEQDAVDQARLFGAFLQGRNTLETMVRQGQLELVLQFADELPAAARRVYLQHIFQNPLALSLLLDRGDYDKLLALAQEDGEACLDEFLSTPKVLERLIAGHQTDLLVEFSRRLKDNHRRQFLQRLLYSGETLSLLLQSEAFPPLLDLICSEPVPNQRVPLLGTLLSRSEVVQHLVTADELTTGLVELIRREPDPVSRLQLLSNLLSRGETVGVLVQAGYLDAILGLIQAQPDARQRSDLLGRWLTAPQVIEHLAAEARLGLLLSFAESRAGPQEDRLIYTGRLFSARPALDALVEHGLYNDLLGLVEREADPNLRAVRMGQLFAAPQALAELVGRNQLGLLLSFARATEPLPARRNYLSQLLHQEPIMTALAKQGLVPELLALCRAEPDETARRRQVALLLLSGQAVDCLAADGELAAIVDNAFEEPEAPARQVFLRSLGSRSAAIGALIKHGQLPAFLKALESTDASTQRQLLRNLVESAPLAELSARGYAVSLLKRITEGPPDSERSYLLERLLDQPKALNDILAADQFEPLLKLLRAESQLGNSVVSSPVVLESFAAHGKLDALFDLVDERAEPNLQNSLLRGLLHTWDGWRALAREPSPQRMKKLIQGLDAPQREDFALRFVSCAPVRRACIVSGNVAALREIISLIPNDSVRDAQSEQLLYAPSGLIAYHLQCGEVGRAEKLLAEATGERGLLAAAAYWLLTNQLDQRIAEAREQYATRQDQAAARRLTFWYRAQGDLAAAGQMAGQSGDPRLLRSLLVELQDWKSAATLQAEELPPPPNEATRTATAKGEELRGEQLGLLAAYQQLAGEQSAFEQTVGRIQQLAGEHPQDQALAWHCAKTLLLNGVTADGLKRTRDAAPLKAFHLLAHRNEYEAGLELLGWQAQTVPDRAWYDRLPATGQHEQELARSRFEAALQVARLLHLLGREEETERLLAWLESYINDLPKPEHGVYPNRLQYWEQVSVALYRMSLTERAWQAGAKSVHPLQTVPPSVLAAVFEERAHEADAWWVFLQGTVPEEPMASRLHRVDLALVPPPGEAEGLFDEVAEQAMQFGESITYESRAADYWHGIGDTCRWRGCRGLAIACLQRAAATLPPAAMALASVYGAEERWQDAAEIYQQVWRSDHERLGALYLAGYALECAGQEPQGRQMKEQASLLALDARTRHRLAVDLSENGLEADAGAQWELLLRLAPPASWESYDAARRLAEKSLDRHPDRAAKLWQHYLLGNLQRTFWFQEDTSYLGAPFLMHQMRAQAAMASADMDQTWREIELARAVTPGDARLAEDLVPMLDRAGQREDADKLAAQLLEHHRRLCAKYPRSAFLHNHLAWTAAHCHRHLDEALAHAERAVQLAPHHGGYVDTLAEVHFRLGDRSTAVRLSEQAVKLHPFDRALQDQHERFRRAPLP